MLPKQIAFALITFLHDAFTVVWVGGLVTLSLMVLPTSVRLYGRGAETLKLMNALQRRLSPFVYASIVGLIVTGVLLGRRNPAFHGLLSFANPYSVALSLKHIVVILMVAIALGRSIVLSRPKERPNPNREKLKGALLFINMALGLATLLLSGIAATLAAGAPTI